MTWKLCGSAPTLPRLVVGMDKFFGGERKQWATDPETGVMSLYQPDGRKIEGFRIRYVRGRYRFEMEC